MAGFWLFKTEPSTYSFDNLVKEKKATWDGVTNPLALKYMKSIAKGDEIFIYHTGSEKAIVGIAKAVSVCYPDPKLKDPKVVVIDIAAERPLVKPVTLESIKKSAIFKEFLLVKIGRLSIMPVPENMWKGIIEMSS